MVFCCGLVYGGWIVAHSCKVSLLLVISAGVDDKAALCNCKVKTQFPFSDFTKQNALKSSLELKKII
jgi:hypothetical protein